MWAIVVHVSTVSADYCELYPAARLQAAAPNSITPGPKFTGFHDYEWCLPSLPRCFISECLDS